MNAIPVPANQRKGRTHMFNTFKCRHPGPERVARLKSSSVTKDVSPIRGVEVNQSKTQNTKIIPSLPSPVEFSSPNSPRITLPSVTLLLGEVKFPLIPI